MDAPWIDDRQTRVASCVTKTQGMGATNARKAKPDSIAGTIVAQSMATPTPKPQFYPQRKNEMREIPMLFSGPMLERLRVGMKTQTRRISKKQRWFPGDRIWVKESLFQRKEQTKIWLKVKVVSSEDLLSITEDDAELEGAEPNWIDGKLDGWSAEEHGYMDPSDRHYPNGCECGNGLGTAREWFIAYWDKLNAKRGYPSKDNPMVWVIHLEIEEASR